MTQRPNPVGASLPRDFLKIAAFGSSCDEFRFHTFESL